MALLEDLKTKILTADGAMGTLLYSYGIDFCYEELNIKKPEVIENIHRQYIEAGADIIQTNTYTANAIKLARYGLEKEVEAFNRAGAKIAKKAAKAGGQYVLGTVGGVVGVRKNEATLPEIIEALLEQATILIDEKVDGLLLETFYDYEELHTLVVALRQKTELPLIAQVSMHEPGVLVNGMSLNDALHGLEAAGANIVGVNCRLGPYHTIQAFENVEIPQHAYLSASPNASLLDVEDGKLVFESEADYFGKAAVLLRNEGVRLIGGCCGTTPAHIREVKKQLANLSPVEDKKVVGPKEIIIHEAEKPRYEALHNKVKRGRSIIVELDTPRHLETEKFIEGAEILQRAGVDAVTMADNSLASPRISNIAMGSILKYEKNVRALAHITCRDRNLIGLQSHLMGLNALGIHDILAVTGDPTKVGDFPGATSVYDVSSMELLQLIKKLNDGISFSGKPLRKKANFSVSAAFNPNVRNVARAIPRLEKKIAAGADYFITQPVYSKEKIIEIYEATKHLDTPIYIGIMPLTSLRNSEFLHHEVPGIKLSEEVLERMRIATTEDPITGQTEGVQIAKELIDTAAQLFNGIYIITPFMRYEMSVELIDYIHQLDQLKRGEGIHVETSY
ncbi:bifunctional homocysteine S-methyltransferase/methylenetetrahydrofolate reductase [Kurthia sibirica]|uniref:Bifunctional homocysteine S-methyltransferase/methylenetetrahydrofolate reductase n=1 Tax=Kurthia sibirica TaxID=202750 RepID=A0A2U3AJ52_9BACL|nr:bifunctional homocysteine S-methyltransferase/methylenetetrahydrofolate reductase [Kurthia sibirica]PWI24575.1 bifunctional homocysteine S-methyltransferase/methylenetetrahydrofolate reductase [Kurthia sibirica]GEK33528.1 bifunctional homocysteine S-methyltransferase/5,10-methylenetetrahydrofolate reductase [Kurthia sibirica]